MPDLAVKRVKYSFGWDLTTSRLLGKLIALYGPFISLYFRVVVRRKKNGKGGRIAEKNNWEGEGTPTGGSTSFSPK